MKIRSFDIRSRGRITLLLITAALAWHSARCLVVTGKDRLTPFLSANDRSRWCTIRALVDHGTYEIDQVITNKGWNTIDKVYHLGQDGLPHYYSSKPPLLATMLAVPYGALKSLTGWTLSERPFLVGRLLIWLVNGALLCILFWGVVGIAERFCHAEWSYVFVLTVLTWGTFLTTFSVTLNNHLPSAAMIGAAMRGFMQFWMRGRSDGACFAMMGLTAALAVAFELPAISFFALVTLALLLASPQTTLRWFVPASAIVFAAFFTTNYQAHGTFRMAYAHRAEGADWRDGNWYNYPGSYWLEENRRGVDRGEPKRWRYGAHAILGHHGIFALTPVWLLSIIGIGLWSQRPGSLTIGVLIGTCLAAVLVFYILTRPTVDRNYGGLTCGFRWSFWLIPLFLIGLMPTLDRYHSHARFRFLAWMLFCISAASALYGSFHPWQHPWIYVVFTNSS